jgi:hypothetical protein
MSKTPVNDVMLAIGYWTAVHLLTVAPVFVEKYEYRLLLLTLIVPNALRMIVNRVPRLAVDRSFFFSATAIGAILTYVLHQYFKESKEEMDEYGKDTNKTLRVSILVATTFAAGALLTYYVGLDRSIYSNLWEATD